MILQEKTSILKTKKEGCTQQPSQNKQQKIILPKPQSIV